MIAGVCFGQMFEIFAEAFSSCPYWRGVGNKEMSARRELTVKAFVCLLEQSSIRE